MLVQQLFFASYVRRGTGQKSSAGVTVVCVPRPPLELPAALLAGVAHPRLRQFIGVEVLKLGYEVTTDLVSLRIMFAL